MTQTNLSDDSLRQTVKEAVAEALNEQRALLRELFSEVLEDFALAEAIRKGKQSEIVSREEVVSSLREKA